MKNLPTIILASFLVTLICLGASGKTDNDELSPADQLALGEKFSSSLVRVEFTLRYDKGEAAEISGWARLCPNCGQYHPIGNAGDLVVQERPLEVAGYLISPTLVATSDVMIHPRFVEKIQVRTSNSSTPAQIKSYVLKQNALILELTNPLKGTSPLSFTPEKDGPYFLITYDKLNSSWTLNVQSLGPGKIAKTHDGHTFRALPGDGIIATKDAAAVGLRLEDKLPLDDSWKTSPLKWPVLTAARMKSLREKNQKQADGSILRAKLNFRSPKASSRRDRYRFMDDEDEQTTTEQNALAVLTEPTKVLILSHLKPKTTARLERITVFTHDDQSLQAEFLSTLRDYGAFLAQLEKPLPSPVRFSSKDIRQFRELLLPSLEVKVQGDQRVTYFKHRRIAQFETGWRSHIYPQIVDRARGIFLFDEDQNLIALPIKRREKVSEDQRWSYDDEPQLTSSQYLNSVLSDLAAHIDPSNVPLSEAEENRLAWLGLVLQGLNRELARVHNISDLTKNGKTGALVSYIYPDSPAARAGLEPGAILLRLHVQGEPKPLEIELEESMGFMENFPWDRLDEIPEQYFEEIPQPWPTAENSFTRALTNLGFGKKFTLEYVQDEQRLKKEFTVTQSPPHYDSAPRYKSEALGLTVRDLTYEVRRYFQKLPDDPGLIISKIEPGSKASVSGIRPYETITHLNDQPVKSVKDFEALIKDQPELRISVKRMTTGRVVKIKMD